ncbi:ADP-ribosyltransferase-containing protein, partial [Massilia antarctica]
MIYQRDGAFRAEADRWVKTGQGQLALKQGGQKYATARGIDEALAVLAEPNAGAFTRTDVRAKVERTVQRWLANLAEWLGMPEAAAYWRGMKNEEARALIQQIFRKTATDFPPADPWAAAGSAALRKGKKALGEAAAPGGSPAFKAWFGNSQVVGPAGEPQVVYHGTDSDFDAFTPSQRGTFGTGVYFAAARDEADAYGERTVEAYLSLQNPWQIDVEHDSDGSVEEDFDSPSVEAILSLPAGRDLLDEAKNGDGMYGLALQAQLKRLGHDGIIATYSDGSREYVAFSPTQVKSATDNNGDFNPADPRIAFSRSGLGDALASAAN